MNPVEVADFCQVVQAKIAAGCSLAAALHAAAGPAKVDAAAAVSLVSSGVPLAAALPVVGVDVVSAHRVAVACGDPGVMHQVVSQLRCEASSRVDAGTVADASVLRWLALALPVMPWVPALRVCPVWGCSVASAVAAGESVAAALEASTAPAVLRRWAVAAGSGGWVECADVVAAELLGCEHVACRTSGNTAPGSN